MFNIDTLTIQDKMIYVVKKEFEMKMLRNSRFYILLGSAFLVLVTFILILTTNAIVQETSLAGLKLSYYFSAAICLLGGDREIKYVISDASSDAKMNDTVIGFKDFFLSEASPAPAAIILFCALLILLFTHVCALFLEKRNNKNLRWYIAIFIVSFISMISITLVPTSFFEANKDVLGPSGNLEYTTSLDIGWDGALLSIAYSWVFSMVLLIIGLINAHLNKKRNKNIKQNVALKEETETAQIEKPLEEEIITIPEEESYSVASGGEKELTISKFKNLLDRGEITEEEFEMIKDRLK